MKGGGRPPALGSESQCNGLRITLHPMATGCRLTYNGAPQERSKHGDTAAISTALNLLS